MTSARVEHCEVTDVSYRVEEPVVRRTVSGLSIRDNEIDNVRERRLEVESGKSASRMCIGGGGV